MKKKSPIEGVFARVRQLRVERAGRRGKAAFAREIGISASTYDYYENSRVPPLEVLLRIAELTQADLAWLLTGKEAGVPPTHPVVRRAARLLADQPDYAAPLGAFVELLAEMAEKLPSDAFLAARGEATATDTPASALAAERQGWIPILGRSAAGVPHFWGDKDERGAVTLAELVSRMPARDARHVRQARAQGELAAEGRAVQIVLLDSPEPPGTAEFVVAEHISRRYSAPFAVRIDGESMEPDLRHGDVVVLSPDCPAEQGKPAVVQLAGQIGVTCKLFRTEGERVHLIPINEAFKATTHPIDQLVWALKVIAHIRSA